MGSPRPVRRLTGGIVALVAAAAFAAPAQATTTIDTATGWDGTQHLWPFGGADAGNTPAYGETVTVPVTDTSLEGFTFHLDVPTDVPFRGEVFAWDDATQSVAGPELWSGPATTTGSYDPLGAAYQAVSFDTGGLALVPGERVILFVTTLRDPSSDGAYGYAAARWGASDAYAGGQFVYSNDGTFSGLLADPWGWFDGGFAAHVDLAFQATFDSSFALSGFPGAPADPRAGQTVPVTWRLTDGSGAPVTSAAGLALASARCGGGAAAPAAAAGASGWQTDGAGDWQVNWKTERTWAGSCRVLTLTLPDGSTSSARFSFR